MATPRFDDLIVIGRLLRPQGRRGEILTQSLSDRQERFPSLRRALIETADGGTQEVKVTDVWPHKGRWVLKLAGVDTISDAERHRGQRLGLPESDISPLPEGSFYHHQLRGLAVESEDGQPLGQVADLMETGAAPVLVVRGPHGETLVPFAEPFIQDVRIMEQRLVVRLLESVDVAG